MVEDRGDFTEEEVLGELVSVGVPEALAVRAYGFTELAWGRVVLVRLKVPLSTGYVCFDASGEVVESGRLAEEACFVEASRVAERFFGSPGFRRLATSSSELHAASQALSAGSKPEGFLMTPAFLFLEPPTDKGMERAQGTIAEHLAALEAQRRSKGKGAGEAERPWWRFWK